jgi:sec-independent protein translocase protein TatC
MTASNSQDKPDTFGQRFRDRGLIGALGKSKVGKNDPNKMHFLEHLEEMRWVIFKSFIAFVLGCLVVAAFLGDSVRLLQRPLVAAVQDFGNLSIDLQACGLSQYQNQLEKKGVTLKDLANATEQDLITWRIDDPQHRLRLLIHFAGGKDRNLLQVIRSYSPIFIAMKICFLGGLGLSLPLILYFVGGFVTPGLTQKEKRIFFPGCLAATFLFLAGSGMTYFFILPLSLAFTIEFSFSVLGLEIYRPEAGNYYSTVIWMTFAVGLAFQFPLVLILLIRIGILTVEKLRSSRRIVLVILMISAALITPGGDPVSLCILTIPLYFLFELSILVGTLIQRRKSSSQSDKRDDSGITGSIILLVALVIFGGAGYWLYQNWEKAESIFLNLDAIGISESSQTSHSEISPDSNLPQSSEFILELLPLDGSSDTNQSNFAPFQKYRARVKP